MAKLISSLASGHGGGNLGEKEKLSSWVELEKKREEKKNNNYNNYKCTTGDSQTIAQPPANQCPTRAAAGHTLNSSVFQTFLPRDVTWYGISLQPVSVSCPSPKDRGSKGKGTGNSIFYIKVMKHEYSVFSFL